MICNENHIRHRLHRQQVGLRPAQLSDLAAVSALLRRAYSRYEADMGAELWSRYASELQPTPAQLEQTLVAELDGEVVGTARYHLAGNDQLKLPAGAALVRLVAVCPAQEGRGIARALMDECVRRARAGGAVSLMLHTMSFMDRAAALYARLGFTRASAYDDRADEHYRLAEPTGFVAQAYSLPLLSGAIEVAS